MAYRNAESVDALQDEIFGPLPPKVVAVVQELHHADRRSAAMFVGRPTASLYTYRHICTAD